MLGASVVGLVLVFYKPRYIDPKLLQEARRSLRAGDFARAESLALAASRGSTPDPWAWIVAGEAAVKTGRLKDALGYYEHVTVGPSDVRAAAAHGRGEMNLQLGDWIRAQAEFQLAIDLQPQSPFSHRRLADLYNLSGRRHLAVPSMEKLIGTQLGTLEDLFYLGDVDHGILLPPEMRASQNDDQADPLISLGSGYEALAENRLLDAKAMFERVLLKKPGDADAAAGLGQAMFHLSIGREADWLSRVPQSSLSDSSVRAVRGLWAEQDGRYEDALFHFANGLVHRDQSRIAWHRLGLSLSRVGRTEDAALALERAQQLQQLALWLDDLFLHRGEVDLVRRVVVQLASFGRTQEALAWANYAYQQSPQSAWPVELIQILEKSPQTLIDVERERRLKDLLDRLFQEERTRRPETKISSDPSSHAKEEQRAPLSFRFDDDAAATGLNFVHYSARQASHLGARIIETTGGGVGVLDYDCDGWPDLCFPQGAKSFPVPKDNPESDRLFRNQFGSSWQDVSRLAGLEDNAFGQGISAGDFDNDGFADLYIANYGKNRLLQNNGDGTFLDVTPEVIHAEPVWTTSCLMADFNSDGHPDLFDVTYCHGSSVETKICQLQGVPRSCSPRAFLAEVDRVWWNQGDGTWARSQNDGLNLSDGLGLGIVAYRPAPDHPITLFIANDEAPNYWLRPQNALSSSQVVWNDDAPIGGLAVDADGKPQACMGVACDDIDGNGLVDLFVTNFFHESNTLYVAASTEFFEDRTRAFGLRDPGWNMLGFGTQFIDVDLDSKPDLIVANGHIDDLRSLGQPYQMPIQFFHNSSDHFVEVKNESELPPAIGRAMVRFDWNRDGQEDVVVVNQGSPTSLLTNRTPTSGKSVRLQFRAISSARDAIGTIVRLTIGKQTLTRQLTAGDGYMASNERQIVIGLGENHKIDSLEIFWPNGVHQSFGPMEGSNTYLLIEGRLPLRQSLP